MQAVILAAGMGSRLGDLKGDRPKGFLKPQELNESLVERSLRILLECGISSVIIGIGYQGHFYEELASRYTNVFTCKNPNFANTGSGYTLQCLQNVITEDFLLLESDLLYEKRAIEVLLQDKRKDLILASGKTHSGDEVYLQTQFNRLEKISKNKSELDHIDGELVGINKISLELYHKLPFSTQKDYEYLLKGFEVLRVEDLVWCEIDTLEHLQRAQNLIIPKLGE